MLECNPLLFHNLDLPGVHTVWGVITVKNKCSIMISTISVMTLRYAIVLLQSDILILYCFSQCRN